MWLSDAESGSDMHNMKSVSRFDSRLDVAECGQIIHTCLFFGGWNHVVWLWLRRIFDRNLQVHTVPSVRPATIACVNISSDCVGVPLSASPFSDQEVLCWHWQEVARTLRSPRGRQSPVLVMPSRYEERRVVEHFGVVNTLQGELSISCPF